MHTKLSNWLSCENKKNQSRYCALMCTLITSGSRQYQMLHTSTWTLCLGTNLQFIWNWNELQTLFIMDWHKYLWIQDPHYYQHIRSSHFITIHVPLLPQVENIFMMLGKIDASSWLLKFSDPSFDQWGGICKNERRCCSCQHKVNQFMIKEQSS